MARMLGDQDSSAEWGYDFSLLLGHLRSLVDDEIDRSRGRRLKLAERADEAVCELEQIEQDWAAQKGKKEKRTGGSKMGSEMRGDE